MSLIRAPDFLLLSDPVERGPRSLQFTSRPCLLLATKAKVWKFMPQGKKAYHDLRVDATAVDVEQERRRGRGIVRRRRVQHEPGKPNRGGLGMRTLLQAGRAWRRARGGSERPGLARGCDARDGRETTGLGRIAHGGCESLGLATGETMLVLVLPCSSVLIDLVRCVLSEALVFPLKNTFSHARATVAYPLVSTAVPLSFFCFQPMVLFFIFPRPRSLPPRTRARSALNTYRSTFA